MAAWALLSACAAESASTLPARYEPGEELPGGATTNTLLGGKNAFLPMAANASVDDEGLFHAGNSFFNQPWVRAPSSTTARDGLGPLFQMNSCSGCHPRDGRGTPPLHDDEPLTGLLLRLSSPGPDGALAPDPVYGGQIQPRAIDGVPAEAGVSHAAVASAATLADGTTVALERRAYSLVGLAHGALPPGTRLSPRLGPQVIGLGLLEAIPLARLDALADLDDGDGDGIRGRVARLADGKVGRFGWKAEAPSLRDQVAGAFLGDMGLTSSLHPAGPCTAAQTACVQQPSGGDPEVDAATLDRVVRYTQLLATPLRSAAKATAVLQGKRLFAELGCAGCHTPSHDTDPLHPIAALAGQRIWPYTDLLLHDMGQGLADDRPAGAADGRSWRTPPLWGIGRLPAVNGHQRLLHDGRADGVEAAILWHDGEGRAARDAYGALSAAERALVVGFVQSL